MCFVWISEQTAIISLYSINWLVFITDTECVNARYGLNIQFSLVLVLEGLTTRPEESYRVWYAQ